MSDVVDVFVPLDELDQPLESAVERALGWAAGTAGAVRVLRRSLDARKGRPLGYRVRAQAARAGEALATDAEFQPPPLRWPAGRPRPRVVIVGSVPDGSLAALRL